VPPLPETLVRVQQSNSVLALRLAGTVEDQGMRVTEEVNGWTRWDGPILVALEHALKGDHECQLVLEDWLDAYCRWVEPKDDG
jgi:hypothetical protein